MVGITVGLPLGVVVAAFFAHVSCFPSSALVFPGETNNDLSRAMSGPSRRQFRPEWSREPIYPENFPSGPGRQNSGYPQPVDRPEGSFPGYGFDPQVSGQPSQSSFQPDLLPFADTSSSTTSTTTEPSTTKIPRRDPGYRIINTATCPCTFTSQYKPVCGTDGQTYMNIDVLNCAQMCGKSVQVYIEGSCGRNNGHAGAISLNYG